MLASVKAYLGEDWKAYEALFKSSLASRVGILNKVNGYIVERSGKQLRPMLCLLTARLFSDTVDIPTVRCAVASEMIHTATLMHDDVADKSDMRRGFPTVSAMLSPTVAVLIGDYWLSRGVSSVLDTDDSEIFRYFTVCLADLAEGEMYQIEKAASLDTTREDYIYVIAHKTASLFQAATKSGARSAGADAARIEAVSEFAYHLGLAFQMRDDILDYSPALSIGKPTGQDIRERKITLPLIGAFENAGQEKRAAVIADIEAGRFDGILPFVVENGGIEYAQQALESETTLAVEALAPFPDNPARELLISLARSLCLREA